jgi:DNA-binding SARP family transcriptional activator
MEFRLLGPVEVLREGQSLPLGGSKPRTLLAALLLAGGRPVSESRLSDVLWDTSPPRTRRAQIHTHVSRLRKQLAPNADVVRARSGYALDVREGTVDLTEFRRRVAQGHEDARRGRHAAASAQLAGALALCSGPALGGTTDFLVAQERPRLEEARLAALEERLAADLARGRHSHVLTELGGLVDEHPLRERLRAHLMTALYRCGRQADALEAYQRGRDRLAAAGLRPGPVLEGVFHAILTADPALDAQPAAPAPPVRANRRVAFRTCLLPSGIADFTGRAAHLDRLGTRLRSGTPGHLVISGGVGVGKSALAVALAHRCLEGFPDGQLYIDLDALPPGRGRTHLALGRLLEALEPERTPPDSVEERARLYRAALAARRVLVLIDEAAAEAQVRPLLPGCGPARAVVTARPRLAALGDTYRTDLTGFTEAEALDLLRGIVGARRIAAEPEPARRLTALCAFLPAAVRAAGARLAARPHWTLGRYAARLADPSRNPLDELRVADLDLRDGLARACRELPAEYRAALARLALVRRRRIPLREAARALALPDHAAEDLLENLAEARVLDAAPQGPSGDVCYTVPEFLGLYLRERTESGRLPK